MPRSALLACAAAAFAAAVWTALSPQDAALSLLLVALALVLAGFVWLEAGTGSAKEVALVAVDRSRRLVGRRGQGARPRRRDRELARIEVDVDAEHASVVDAHLCQPAKTRPTWLCEGWHT